jgi:PAS domain S-box-containing protein
MLHLTGAKARVGRARKTRADLEQQLEACRREIDQARERLVEAMKQQTATSEVLRIISSSPTHIQPVLDAVAENAARLCDADNAVIFRLDGNILRLVALCGDLPATSRAREEVPATRDTVIGRATCDRRTIHVHNLAAEVSEYPVGSTHAKREGHRTTLATPLLREGTPIGVILIRRMEVRPFYDRQIALLETFADQAAIAIEHVRLFEAEKQRTEALRRSEAHLAEAQRLSHTGSAIYNATTILHWSEETYRIWGFDPLQGAPSRAEAVKRIHRDDRDRALEEAEHAWREKRGYSLEYRIVLPDGTVKHLEANSRPVFSASGELVEITVTHIDLTERKRADESLRESEAKFRDYAETASDWFWEIGPDYKFTMLTENAFGSHPADRIGTACWDRALDLETQPEKWRLIRATLDARKPFRDFVYCASGGNGSSMYVRASGKPVFDSNGEFRGYRGTGTDVTALMRAQEEQRRGEASLAQAQRLSHTGNWVYNATTMRYLYWSDESYRIWGFDPLQGLPSREDMWQRIHPDDRDRVREEVQEALREKRDFEGEFRIVLPDGTVKYLEATTHHEFSSLGALVEAVSTNVDVTERKRAQDERERLRQLESDLAHMNRLSMMGELTASLAHEITQPIAAARNNAGAAMRFLDRNPPDLGEVQEALECLVADTDRAGDIIDRIRDHIRKAPPRKGRFDLNKAINEVIALAESAITTNGVSVRTRLAQALLPVQGDRVQLQQVVLNLMLNAVEAMSTIEAGPRELSISTEQTQTGGILVSVRDSGPGIDPDHLDRVFEAFYTTKSSGVGMGLSICRSIIDAHGGRLWADMNASGGAIFRFTLPDADKELTNSLGPTHLTREPHEDTESNAAHQPAYEGSKRPHRSRRGRGQRRRGRQSQGSSESRNPPR